jgi:flagellin-like hook-associated protein FlgL
LDSAKSQRIDPSGKRPAPIILNRPAAAPAPASDSIFLADPAPVVEQHPVGWKQLEPGELQAPAVGGMEGLEVFSRSGANPAGAKPAEVPAAEINAPEIQPPVAPALPRADKSPITVLAPVVPATAPTPLQPPVVLSSPATAPKITEIAAPLPLPVVSASPLPMLPKPVKKEAPPARHVVPPMLDQSAPPPFEKLRPPQLPSDARPPEPLPVIVAKSPVEPAPVSEPKVTPPTTPTSAPAAPQPAPALKAVPPPIPASAPALKTVPPPLPASAPALKAAPPPIPTSAAKPTPPPTPARAPAPKAATPPSPASALVAAKPAPAPTSTSVPAPSPAVPQKLVEKEKSVPVFLFPPAKPKRTEVTPPVTEIKSASPGAASPTIKVEEAKPALRPPVLPKRTLAIQAEELAKHAPEAKPEEKVPGSITTIKTSAPVTPARAPEPAKPPTPAKPEAKAPAPQAASPAKPAPPQIPATKPEPAKPTTPVTPEAKAPAPQAAAPAKSTPGPIQITQPAFPTSAAPVKPTAPVSAAKATPPQTPGTTPAVKTTATGKAAATTTSKAKTASGVAVVKKDAAPVSLTGKTTPIPASAPAARAARAKKRRLIGTFVFYGFFAICMFFLYVGGIFFSHETRVEGQVIPPTGMVLANEVWIVGDFRGYASGIADDLAAERAPKLHDIQAALDHVQRARADVASREERIRIYQEQIQAAKADIAAQIKQARDAAQQIWDGPGAQLEDEYNSRLSQLQKAIADRAAANKLKYQPDDSYRSPEVWANAYRLALYDVPAGVDSAKEHQWLEDQLKLWRDFTKSLDDRQKQMREQAAQIQLAPTGKVTEVNSKIEDLQHRIEGTLAEEEPIKAELVQAQTDLTQAQVTEEGLDDKYYKQLVSLPEGSITKRLPLATNGRFTWSHIEKDSPFTEFEKQHHYWIFSRAIRTTDGRQYWALHRFTIGKDHTVAIVIEPTGFISTKALLRPDLSPEEWEK